MAGAYVVLGRRDLIVLGRRGHIVLGRRSHSTGEEISQYWGGEFI